MARRLVCLRDWDHPAKPGVIVAYKAGWKGLVPEAARKAAPDGVFQEIGRDGTTRKP